jgi:hypothetical protein
MNKSLFLYYSVVGKGGLVEGGGKSWVLGGYC